MRKNKSHPSANKSHPAQRENPQNCQLHPRKNDESKKNSNQNKNLTEKCDAEQTPIRTFAAVKQFEILTNATPDAMEAKNLLAAARENSTGGEVEFPS